VAALLGDPFAQQLHELEVGRSQGPVASGYGVHLVLLEEREEGRMPSFEQIRDELERDWRHDRISHRRPECLILSRYVKFTANTAYAPLRRAQGERRVPLY
jgi:hypothetical protein